MPKKIKPVFVIPLLAGAFLVGLMVLWQNVHAKSYEGRIFEGVHIGEYNFSGMTLEQAVQLLSNVAEEFESGGFSVSYTDAEENERSVTIFPSFYRDSQQERLITIEPQATAELLMQTGRYGSMMRQWQTRLRARFYKKSVMAVVQLDMDLFKHVLLANIAPSEVLVQNAQVVYHNGSFSVAAERPGVTYPLTDQLQRAQDAIRELRLPELRLVAEFEEPSISAQDLTGFSQEFTKIVELGPMVLTYADEDYNKELSWAIPKHMIAQQLSVDRDEKGRLFLRFVEDEFNGWLKENVLDEVQREPQEARFELSEDGSKVTTFVPSHDGIVVDKEALSEKLAAALGARHAKILSNIEEPASTPQAGVSIGNHTQERIELSTANVEPNVSTEQSNKYGIKEIIGVGVSDFSGSPANRIKNISNAVNKLNGVLIAPGEEFSLINALKPFTYSNGYLDELVIKGDEIKPEIAGGLCQIGTTSFRMAMNSGLNITQRRNHSLVVSYYNDPINGNPGTDATIYDPAPDFRFINDTGHHVLWQTAMNARSGRLIFTLWGVNDGRKGSYTAPVVERWIATGPTVETLTTDLQPGVRECQSKHPGAEASFTYTVVMPGGEKKQTVYDSYYRPLPEICLIGATQEEIDAQEQEEKQEELADILFPDSE